MANRVNYIATGADSVGAASGRSHSFMLVALLLLMALPQPAPAAEDGEREILYWVAPMDPNYRRDGPGKSPMGMDLIPVYADEVGGGDGDGRPTVEVSPSLANSLGVRTAKVERAELSRRIDTVGYFEFDERQVSHVHLRAEGWVEDLRVRTVGEPVEAGDLLFRYYSPQLVNAQEEYLQALSVGDKRLRQASRERLLALGVPREVAAGLEKDRRVRQQIPVHARQDGFVAELNIREGMYVKPAMEVMTLADLASVWVLVDVFERQADWVRPGQRAEVRTPYLPGEVWKGEVEYVYPTLDPKTRTLKVRLRFDNPEGRLKPNMYAKATLFAEPREALAIPREALIRTGSEDRVVLAKGEGRFQPVPVEAGIESGDRVEIRSGLEAGDRVVVSAQFLIDSESSLKASFLRMDDPEPREEEPAEPLAVAESRGVLHSLDPDAGKLNMTHEPIPELGWPAMTMDFAVDPAVSLEGFAPDQTVTFEVHQTGQTEFVIVAMEPADAATKEEAGPPRFTADAVLNSIDGSSVNLTHEPIPALGWPPMTMDLPLAEGASLEGLEPGQEVTFELLQLDAVTYQVTAISPKTGEPKGGGDDHAHH